MKKAYITPKVTLYDVTTDTKILSSSEEHWHISDFDPPHGGIIDEDDEADER